MDQLTYQIVSMYNSGLSSIEVASKLGITKRKVLYWLKKTNIKRRSLSEALRTYKINNEFFRVIDTESKAYWLGFLLADANIGYTGRYGRSSTLRCTLQRRDKQHLELFMKALNTDKSVKNIIATNRKTRKQYPAAFVRITCTELCKDLEKFGWHAFKREGDTQIIDAIQPDLQRHTVRGLVDGDGWLIFTSNRWIIGYCDLHKSVVEWVKNWLNTGGSRVRRTKNKSYRITYTGNKQTTYIANLLYTNMNIALSRKSIAATSIIQGLREKVPHQPVVLDNQY